MRLSLNELLRNKFASVVFTAWITALGMLCTKPARADGDYGWQTDTSYFKGVKVSTNTLIAIYPLKDMTMDIYEHVDEKQAKSCSYRLHDNNCGPALLANDYYGPGPGDSMTVALQALVRKGSWVKIPMNPRESKDVWIDLGPNVENKMWGPSVLSLSEWLASADYIQVAREAGTWLSIRSEPNDGAKDLSDCSSGDIRLDKETPTLLNGDWMAAYCRENDCSMQAGHVQCQVGWVRWRSANGYLVAYPGWFQQD